MRKVRISRKTDALVVVDLQNDFCPGGSLAVPGGDEIVPVANFLMPLFDTVAATMDWHPKDHCSFKGHGGQWPLHCVQGTQGAELHSDLDQSFIQYIFYKGFIETQDDYSGFAGFGRHRENEPRCFAQAWAKPPVSLREGLRRERIKRIFVVGFATDYCVKATVLEGLKLGFEVVVVSDAIRAVNVNPNDGEKALREMRKAGARVVSSKQIKS